MVQWVLKGAELAFCRFYAFPPAGSHGQIDLLNSETLESLESFSLVSIYIVGMWPCNVAFVCQKVCEYNCNDDCF